MAEGVMDRCPSGIVGFDKLCEGGFVRNSDNLIVGGPGSGKTTFLLQFLWNGATKFDENGLYCSFEPDIVETLKDGMAYGWDFFKLSENGKIKFMRFAPQTTIEELKGELTKAISKNNIRRICFDPVSVLALNQTESGKIRQTIFELSSLMKRLKVTSLLADETMDGEGLQPKEGEWTKTDILRFLSDSVTILYETGIAGVGDRAIKISKMRRTNHERKAIGMRMSNMGIEIALLSNNPNETSNTRVISVELPVRQEAHREELEYLKKVQKEIEEAKARIQVSAIHTPPMNYQRQQQISKPLPSIGNSPREEFQKKIQISQNVPVNSEDMHNSGIQLQRPFVSQLPDTNNKVSTMPLPNQNTQEEDSS